MPGSGVKAEDSPFCKPGKQLAIGKQYPRSLQHFFVKRKIQPFAPFVRRRVAPKVGSTRPLPFVATPPTIPLSNPLVAIELKVTPIIEGLDKPHATCAAVKPTVPTGTLGFVLAVATVPEAATPTYYAI